jgi:hypothetical protein
VRFVLRLRFNWYFISLATKAQIVAQPPAIAIAPNIKLRFSKMLILLLCFGAT